MPELPEVETVARLIEPDVLRRRIEAVTVDWERSLGGLSVREFSHAVVGTRIVRVWRRAKHIVLDLKRGREAAGHLLVHLRMSGRLQVCPKKDEVSPYTRIFLQLDRGRLEFVDVRKFGRFLFRIDPSDVLGDLGPEPLSEDFSDAWFHEALSSRKRILKSLLLDQTFLAGLGNIYVDEALHRARLHPLTTSDRISKAVAARLAGEIRATLAEAIEREGSSFDTFYRTPEGQPGSYQHQFQVYGRQGQDCLACGEMIEKTVVGQRGTHFCPRCQRRPRPQRSGG
ncbi:MAG: formamidopyrimidine-DNA glycosylase [Planctomycetota bacterium]|jgi:formamidopyrimidine-DNA glycosylase